MLHSEVKTLLLCCAMTSEFHSAAVIALTSTLARGQQPQLFNQTKLLQSRQYFGFNVRHFYFESIIHEPHRTLDNLLHILALQAF